MTFPQYAVSKWIGHSITVSGRHYANDVPDEVFTRAVEAGSCAQQKVHETAGNSQKEKRVTDNVSNPSSGSFKDLRDISVSPCKASKWSRGELNPRPVVVDISPLHVYSLI